VEFRLLGPFGLVVDGRQVELGSPKQRAVLALLAFEPARTVSVDRITDLLWGEEPPASATSSIHAYVSNLRRALRGGDQGARILRQGLGYRLELAGASVDLECFRSRVGEARAAGEQDRWVDATRLSESALSLWRDQPVVDLIEFGELAHASIVLTGERTAAQQFLARSLLEAGDAERAAALGGELLRADPLREETVALTMRAQYRSGRIGEALDVYRAFSEKLADELGLDPSASLNELQGAILQRNPALESPVRRSVTPTTASELAPPLITDDAVIGREAQRNRLRTALHRARGGGPVWVAVSGPAGIGKTTLADWLTEQAREDGATIAWTRNQDDEAVPSWWTLRQLLRGIVDNSDSVLDIRGSEADAERYLIFERTAAALQDAADRAGFLTIVVDDVQWADANSVRALSYLCTALRSANILLVLTVRDGDHTPDVTRLLTAVARTPGSERVAVPPMRPVDVADLVRAVSTEEIDSDEAAELARAAEGNPFFVVEYARLPPSERSQVGPTPGIRAVLEQRIAGLEPEILSVLRVAAVAGDEIDIAMLSALTGLDTDELADVIDEAVDQHILAVLPDEIGYGFAHALLREHIVKEMSPLRRQRLHLRAAEWAATSAGGVALAAYRRANHLVAALPLSDASETFDACTTAARTAEEEYDAEAAAGWWRQAIAVHKELSSSEGSAAQLDSLRIAYVEALARAGRGQTVLDAVDEGILEAIRQRRSTSVGLLAASLLRTAGAWPWASSGEDPGHLLNRLAGVEPLLGDDPAAHVRVLAALAVGSYYHPDDDVREELSSRAVAIAEGLGDADVLADALLGRALTFIGAVDHAEDARSALTRLQELPHSASVFDDALAHAMLTMTCFSVGEVTEARRHLLEGTLASDLLRLPVVRVQLRWMQGLLSQWAGDQQRAEREYHLASAMHHRTELYLEGVDQFAEFCIRYQLDDVDAIRPLALHSGQAARWAQIVVAAEDGDAASARTEISEILRRSRPMTWTTIGSLVVSARAASRLALAGEVRQLVAALEPYRRRLANVGQVGYLGTVAGALAQLHRSLGDLSEAESCEAIDRELSGRL
jgi:DNA-binding SARP family transcriptional activator/nucleoside-triphosphatase THEP1